MALRVIVAAHDKVSARIAIRSLPFKDSILDVDILTPDIDKDILSLYKGRGLSFSEEDIFYALIFETNAGVLGGDKFNSKLLDAVLFVYGMPKVLLGFSGTIDSLLKFEDAATTSLYAKDTNLIIMPKLSIKDEFKGAFPAHPSIFEIKRKLKAEFEADTSITRNIEGAKLAIAKYAADNAGAKLRTTEHCHDQATIFEAIAAPSGALLPSGGAGAAACEEEAVGPAKRKGSLYSVSTDSTDATPDTKPRGLPT